MGKTLYTERHRKLRELLIAKRKAAGLTQTVLAGRLGKPPSYVAKYELGERRLDCPRIPRYCRRDWLRSLRGDPAVGAGLRRLQPRRGKIFVPGGI